MRSLHPVVAPWLALALAATPGRAASPGGAAAFPARTLLDRVQSRTYEYFRELAHPVSGMTPERTSTPEVVTTGGTGFGIMATVVAVARGFESRQAGRARVLRIARFLARAPRFHGAFAHWMDGATGAVIPFSPRDDGGDLVETAFLLQGLLTARQFFDSPHPDAVALRALVDSLAAGVEWSWFARPGRPGLSWHWSPNHGFAMDLAVQGWNEALVVYVLAAGARAFPLDPDRYHQGWAAGTAFANGARYYGVRLPLGPPFGGPLFLSHYSFLGLDPRRLRDRYADYGEQVRAHVRINWEHCVRDPGGHGYSPTRWGLTASDTPGGYAAHSPQEDRGVLAPTAALASFPFAPRRAWAALVDFLGFQGGRLFGPRGFVDAFQPATGWVARDQLAIDQGPIVVMLENHRSGLPWRLFMGCPEVTRGLARLGFTVAPRPARARPAGGEAP